MPDTTVLLNISKDERNHTLRNLTPAKYKVWVSAISDAGAGPSRELYFVIYGKQICEWAESICHNIFCMCLRKSSRICYQIWIWCQLVHEAFHIELLNWIQCLLRIKYWLSLRKRICFHPNSLLNFVLYVYHVQISQYMSSAIKKYII